MPCGESRTWAGSVLVPGEFQEPTAAASSGAM